MGRAVARRGRGVGGLILALALAGCGFGGEPGPPERLGFEDRLAPEAFEREAPAVRDAPDGAAGLWAAVPDLPRPERALVLNIANGDEVEVALFAGRRGTPVRLSVEAAEALGIGDDPVNVRITALRRQPKIDYNLW